MNFVMISLKINMTSIQNYYSQTHTVYKIKAKGVYEEIRRAKCLISVIIRQSQNTMIIQIRKIRDETEVLQLKNLLD